jgi:stage II sporulation protein M
VPAVFAMALIAGVSVWLGYDWIKVNIPQVLHSVTPERLEKIESGIHQMPDLTNLEGSISAPFLFMNNTRAVAAIFVVGLFSFGVLGILLYMLNIGLIGGLYALIELLGLNPMPMFINGVLPHGIFEIPALMIGSALALYMGAVLVTPQTGKSMGEIIIELLADWLKIFLGVVIPLLAVAAVIEAYITPGLLLSVLTK